MNIGERITQLRKEAGISRDELGKRVGTSGAIIGRYERNEMMPSFEVAYKIADALGVTLDFLAGSTSLLIKDKKMQFRLELLQRLSGEQKERILYVLDSLLRDAQQQATQQQLA